MEYFLVSVMILFPLGLIFTVVTLQNINTAHRALLKCDFEVDAAVMLDNHNDYKDTWYLHVWTEYVYEDYSCLKIDNHTEYKDTWYLHVLTEYVAEDYPVV